MSINVYLEGKTLFVSVKWDHGGKETLPPHGYPEEAEVEEAIPFIHQQTILCPVLDKVYDAEVERINKDIAILKLTTDTVVPESNRVQIRAYSEDYYPDELNLMLKKQTIKWSNIENGIYVLKYEFDDCRNLIGNRNLINLYTKNYEQNQLILIVEGDTLKIAENIEKVYKKLKPNDEIPKVIVVVEDTRRKIENIKAVWRKLSKYRDHITDVVKKAVKNQILALKHKNSRISLAFSKKLDDGFEIRVFPITLNTQRLIKNYNDRTMTFLITLPDNTKVSSLSKVYVDSDLQYHDSNDIEWILEEALKENIRKKIQARKTIRELCSLKV